MKRIVLLFLSLFILISFVVCSGSVPRRSDTDLEFWIAENVDDVDLSQYTEKYGLMGGREYYGSGYVPTVDENGEQIDPEHCVIYTVTSYPDYLSEKKHITRITITDPTVAVYGLTLNSSEADIRSVMEKEGFKLKEYENSYGSTYVKGKFSFHFTEECMRISVDVSNIMGIQF